LAPFGAYGRAVSPVRVSSPQARTGQFSRYDIVAPHGRYTGYTAPWPRCGLVVAADGITARAGVLTCNAKSNGPASLRAAKSMTDMAINADARDVEQVVNQDDLRPPVCLRRSLSRRTRRAVGSPETTVLRGIKGALRGFDALTPRPRRARSSALTERPSLRISRGSLLGVSAALSGPSCRSRHAHRLIRNCSWWFARNYNVE